MLMLVSLVLALVLNLSECVCDVSKRNKKCDSYSTCQECTECDQDCAWCAIGGLCSKFCGAGLDAKDCKDDACAKAADEFKCMQMVTSGDAAYDFQRRGGISVDKNKKAKKEIVRGIDKSPNSERKARAYDPYVYVDEDLLEKSDCPDCKEQTYFGQDEGVAGEPPKEGIAALRGGS